MSAATLLGANLVEHLFGLQFVVALALVAQVRRGQVGQHGGPHRLSETRPEHHVARSGLRRRGRLGRRLPGKIQGCSGT